MNFYVIPSLITSIFMLLLGIFVLKNNIKSKVNKTFFYMVIPVCIWLGVDCITFSSSVSDKALFWAKISFSGLIFIPIMIYQFSITFLQLKREKKFLLPLYIVGFFFVLLTNWTDLVIDGVKKYFWGYYPIGNKGLLFSASIYIGLFVKTILLYIKRLKDKTLTPLDRSRIKYILIAFCIAVFLWVDYLPMYKINIYPFGSIIVLIFFSIITYTIVKYRLMDIKLAVTRGLLFGFVHSFILALPIGIALWGDTYFTDLFGDKWWIGLIMLGIMLSGVGQVIYRYVRSRIEESLLKEQHRYHQYLREASKGMIFVRDLRKLQRLIVHILTRGISIKSSTLFMYDDEKKVFELVASRGLKKNYQDICINKNHPLIKLLQNKKSAILYEEARSFSQEVDIDLKEVEKIMREMEIALIIPNFVRDSLIGFLMLGHKKNRTFYTSDDIKILTTLANHAALAMENAQFYNKVKEQEATLVQTCKLTSLGEMAGGFAHQINNPLSAITLVAGNARIDIDKYLRSFSQKIIDNDEKKDIESIFKKEKDKFQVIEERAIHIGKIIKSILRFAKPTEFEDTDIELVLEGAMRLIPRTVFHRSKVRLVKNIPSDLPKIKARTVDLQQVFMNLCINGIESMDGKGGILKIEAKVKSGNLFVSKGDYREGREKNKSPQFIEVKISDTGYGIEPKDMPRIYDYFFTTKGPQGTGLGLALVYQIVKEHNGIIEVESEIQKGTIFSVCIPAG